MTLAPQAYHGLFNAGHNIASVVNYAKSSLLRCAFTNCKSPASSRLVAEISFPTERILWTYFRDTLCFARETSRSNLLSGHDRAIQTKASRINDAIIRRIKKTDKVVPQRHNSPKQVVLQRNRYEILGAQEQENGFLVVFCSICSRQTFSSSISSISARVVSLHPMFDVLTIPVC